MKLNELFCRTLLLLFAIFTFYYVSAQGVAINNDKTKPDSTAMLDVSSVNKGVLIPRVHLVHPGDLTTIPGPAYSLLVYNTSDDLVQFPLGPGYYYNIGIPEKPAWIKLLNANDNAANQWGLNGNQVNNANFIGTTNAQDFILKGHNVEGLRIGKGGALLAGNYPDLLENVVPASGPGTRLMWIPARHAFRAGKAYATEWDDANIGIGSFAVGSNAKAVGSYTIGMGLDAAAFGVNAIAMGSGATASSSNTIALGPGATATKPSAIAIGEFTNANGNGAASIGKSNDALGISSLATGENTTAKGNWSAAMGYNTIANAYGALAIGRYNVDAVANAAVPAALDRVFQIGDGTSAAARKDIVYVTRNGNMSIAGVLSVDGMLYPSDLRLKKNVKPLQNVLTNISNIQPITYYFKDKDNYPATHQIGFSAQEIEQEFPELINKTEQGYLSVNYPLMSAVAIQAIKEQQQIIEKLTTENIEIKKRLEQLEKIILKNNL